MRPTTGVQTASDQRSSFVPTAMRVVRHASQALFVLNPLVAPPCLPLKPSPAPSSSELIADQVLHRTTGPQAADPLGVLGQSALSRTRHERCRNDLRVYQARHVS